MVPFYSNLNFMQEMCLPRPLENLDIDAHLDTNQINCKGFYSVDEYICSCEDRNRATMHDETSSKVVGDGGSIRLKCDSSTNTLKTATDNYALDDASKWPTCAAGSTDVSCQVSDLSAKGVDASGLSDPTEVGGWIELSCHGEMVTERGGEPMQKVRCLGEGLDVGTWSPNAAPTAGVWEEQENCFIPGTVSFY